ncbi:MAG: prepilin-type N-terminal cleavage/methylation domain-containing protein [Candidatus Omnitrophica bacterium]|jgi:prepilin-type N-terminal cleavage/methylation domain-containing protein|nr:prepilin-type N-terminal cleavage/methylation domain-containing protein [Candidatus Omnitrophota bacterium]MDD3274953.1 prepilin-type N-terminal cleavage/methylation domain-containing protein [Candidatus Omnitrophota bacterium]MDD5078473.1 prepilin-type N-terminal cleavage/methylation domain-containing protein [Candidatus Omnitrophota bacterium]MDD5724902.1 prepilin-type N-terminal cleavage/methylation domain-containing protein [Candidatus Omnitrophota bacterium]
MKKPREAFFQGYPDFKGSFRGVSLIELMICIVAISIMILSFYGLETYSHKQLIGADRRSKVQNSLAYCMEHMSKYVQQASGNASLGYPAIELYPSASSTKTGFQVRVDLNTPHTASFDDDALIYYTLSGNTLSVGCTGTCGSFTGEALSSKVVANFSNSVMPVDPTDGFYVETDYLGTTVDIGLVGRYYPDQESTMETRQSNPQVAMRAKLICNNSSIN